MLKKLYEKGLGYWLTSITVLLLGIFFINQAVDSRLDLHDVKNYLFMHLSKSSTNPSTPRSVKLVLIDDDDFWDGEFHHRNPTDREQLAKIIQKVDEADAKAIALDFDLRLPHPVPADTVTIGDLHAMDPYGPYQEETKILVKAIVAAAENRPVILAKTIDGEDPGPYDLKGDVYQTLGICKRLLADGAWDNPGSDLVPINKKARPNIHCGYIALMDDSRRIPPPARITGNRYRLDSFSMALARAVDGEHFKDFSDGSYYASYIDQETLDKSDISISSHDLINDTEKKSLLSHRPVIIGADWHTRAKPEVPSHGNVDLNDTPIGLVAGALIHANLVEAALSNRFYYSPDEFTLHIIDIAIGIAAAVLFALADSLLGLFAMILATAGILFLMQWMALQMFALFLDMYLPVLGLALHAIVDRLLESGHGGRHQGDNHA